MDKYTEESPCDLNALAVKPFNNPADVRKANPGISIGWILSILGAILGPIVKVITPIIRKALEETLLDQYEKAKETDNPWDDWLFWFLLAALKIPIPE